MCKCNLRCVCIVLGALFVGAYAFFLFYITKFSVLYGVLIVVGLVGALALLFGAILEDERLMLVAFIVMLIEIIPCLIVILGVIGDFNGFRDLYPKSQTVNSIVAELVVELVLHLILTYVVYAYYKQLRDNEDE